MATPDMRVKTTAPPDAASPAEPRLSNFADLVFDGTVGENSPEVDTDFAAGMMMGPTPLMMEKTSLDQIQSADGGLLHTTGDPGNAATWLCYTRHAATKVDKPVTVWLISDGEMAGRHTLSLVVVQQVDAARVSGCATAPKTLTFPAFGVPAIGASLAGLRARFGTVVRDRQHNAYYTSARPLNDGTGKSVYQTLGYAIDRQGRVTGISVSQVTTE